MKFLLEGAKMGTSVLKTLIFFFILFSVAVLHSSDKPYAFKNLQLGSNISKITSDRRFNCKPTNSPVADKSCRLVDKYIDRQTIAEAPIDSMALYYFDDSLTTIVITFEKTHFAAVKDTLRRKYGASTRGITETYVDPSGELFMGHVYEWDNQVSTIDAVQYFSFFDYSAVVYKLDLPKERLKDL
ncbi:hypothetical protein ACFL0M_04495 [Thermodesulfobacteriota bacterium]